MITDRLPAEGLVLCAVSGGADSMYLLERLRSMGCPVAAAHYDHGLRGAASASDAAFVREWCAEHDIPFITEKGDVAGYASANGLGIEEAGRELRYSFLERAADELGAGVIATAHTADDNAETVLLHLTRGAGLRGLGGIPPVRGRIVRPLLDTTRAEVLAWLAEHGIPFVEDETNASDDYARNRIRHRVIPPLREENPAFARTVSRTAFLLREDEEYLDGLARSFLQENLRRGALPVSALSALPDPVARRVLRRMLGNGLSFEQTERILAAVREGRSTDHVLLSEGQVRFSREKDGFLPDRVLCPGDALSLPEAGMTVFCQILDRFPADVHTSFNTFFLRCANINGTISVTARRPGDRLRPLGRGCTKTLKALFLEAHIPVWERDLIPVLRDERGVLSVCGFPPDERVAAKPGDQSILKVDFLREKPEREG